MHRYFAIVVGERLGPFTLTELAQLVTTGALAKDATVEPEDGGPGLSLDKLLDRQQNAGETPTAGAPAPIPPAAAIPSPQAPVKSDWRFYFQAGWTILLAVLSIYLLSNHTKWFFLDYANLIIHESGHLVFGFCGEFITALGGTIMQLLIPFLMAGYFILTRQTAGAQFGLFWFGQNCMNVSVYVADARAMALPLVGGGEHDWHYLLGRLGLLEQDAQISLAIIILGALFFAAAVFWPFMEKTVCARLPVIGPGKRGDVIP